MSQLARVSANRIAQFILPTYLKFDNPLVQQGGSPVTIQKTGNPGQSILLTFDFRAAVLVVHSASLNTIAMLTGSSAGRHK